MRGSSGGRRLPVYQWGPGGFRGGKLLRGCKHSGNKTPFLSEGRSGQSLKAGMDSQPLLRIDVLEFQSGQARNACRNVSDTRSVFSKYLVNE